MATNASKATPTTMIRFIAVLLPPANDNAENSGRGSLLPDDLECKLRLPRRRRLFAVGFESSPQTVFRKLEIHPGGEPVLRHSGSRASPAFYICLFFVYKTESHINSCLFPPTLLDAR